MSSGSTYRTQKRSSRPGDALPDQLRDFEVHLGGCPLDSQFQPANRGLQLRSNRPHAVVDFFQRYLGVTLPLRARLRCPPRRREGFGEDED